MNSPAKSSDAAPGAGRTRARKILRRIESVLAVVGLCFIVYHAAFEFAVMTSDSMAPALQGTSYENGDRILIERASRWVRAPKRWEIYSYYDAEGTPVAKRIVGMPGEKISLREGKVYINGVELERPRGVPPVQYYNLGSLAIGREIDCGQGYFMLGDASIDSYDSRYTGLVTKDRFRGRAWCIVWPYTRIGFVK